MPRCSILSASERASLLALPESREELIGHRRLQKADATAAQRTGELTSMSQICDIPNEGSKCRKPRLFFTRKKMGPRRSGRGSKKFLRRLP